MMNDTSRRTIHVVLVVEAVTYPDLVSVGENPSFGPACLLRFLLQIVRACTNYLRGLLIPATVRRYNDMP